MSEGEWAGVPSLVRRCHRPGDALRRLRPAGAPQGRLPRWRSGGAWWRRESVWRVDRPNGKGRMKSERPRASACLIPRSPLGHGQTPARPLDTPSKHVQRWPDSQWPPWWNSGWMRSRSRPRRPRSLFSTRRSLSTRCLSARPRPLPPLQSVLAPRGRLPRRRPWPRRVAPRRHRVQGRGRPTRRAGGRALPRACPRLPAEGERRSGLRATSAGAAGCRHLNARRLSGHPGRCWD